MTNLNELLQDIQERERLLQGLYKEHWLYDMQKQTLDDKKREYEFLRRQEDEKEE